MATVETFSERTENFLTERKTLDDWVVNSGGQKVSGNPFYQAWSNGLNEKTSASGPVSSNLDPNSKPFAPRQVILSGENIPTKQGMYICLKFL